MIKAALLAEIYHDFPCLKGEEESLGLFQYTEELDADKISLPLILMHFEELYNIKVHWILGPPGKEIANIISNNLRYNSSDRIALIFSALEQALFHGYSYCLSGVGDISHIFLKRAKVVSHEIHRMIGFIRFYPASNDTLVAQPKLYHYTADLILKRFVKRYPQKRLVFLLEKTAIALEHGNLITLPIKDYLPFIQDHSFQQTWETYYRSQYIATRKNTRLAQRCIPQKYWSWLQEGKLLAEEKFTP